MSTARPSPLSIPPRKLLGFRDARFVALDGLGYTATPNFLIRTADGWKGEFHVPPGKLHYAFIVDGKRILDPANQRHEDKWSQMGTSRFSVQLIPAEDANVFKVNHKEGTRRPTPRQPPPGAEMWDRRNIF